MDQSTISNRTRRKWVAALLSLVIPSVSMLYLGRPKRAGFYLVLTIVVSALTYLLASNGVWPAGIGWGIGTYPITIAGIIDSIRICRRSANPFNGPWYTRWYGLSSILVTGFLGIIGFRTFLYEPFVLPAGSMLPTLHVGDYIFVDKQAVTPTRGDIVVFRLPSDPAISYVKRVIGLPGDTIEYDRESKVIVINGNALEQEFIGTYDALPVQSVRTETIDGKRYSILTLDRRSVSGGQYSVPAGHYFMLGDNRDNSQDSRFRDVGFVPAENILGRVTLIWWNTDSPERAGMRP